MAGFDLASIIQQAADLNAGQTQQSQQIADMQMQSAQKSNQIADNLNTAAVLQKEADLTSLQGQLNTQQARVKAANAFGTNVNDVSDVITMLGSQMRSDAASLLQANNKVTEIEANSDLLTNPGGWLRDLFQGDAARAERNALASRFDQTSKTVQALNAGTQATATTQNAISETLTAASIKNIADAKQLTAQTEAEKASIQALQYGAASVDAMRQQGAQNFNRSMQTYSQITEEARWQEGMALRKAQFEELQASRDARKMEKQAFVDATQRVNAYRSAAGLPEVNEAFIRRTLVQPGELGEQIRRQEQQGMNVLEGKTGAKLFGANPAEAIKTLQQDNPNLPPAYAPSLEILGQAKNALNAEVTEAEKNITGEPTKTYGLTKESKKDPAVLANTYNKIVQQTAIAAQSNIQHGKDNPYQAVPIQTVLQEVPALAQSNFGQKVLGSLTAVGKNDATPELVLATAVSSLNKGEITFNEARDGIAKFYENAVAIKNATSGFLALSIPPQQGYKTKIGSLNKSWVDSLGAGLEAMAGSRFAGMAKDQANAASKILDFTKPSDITTAITVLKAKATSSEILQKYQNPDQK